VRPLIKLLALLLAVLGVGLTKRTHRRVRRGKHYSNDEF
jgi:hypothetical protein